MRFHYTKHLQKRIRQRELSLAEIAKTVASPDRKLPTYKGRYLAQKSFRGNILEVVYKEEEGSTILITAYWLEEKG